MTIFQRIPLVHTLQLVWTIRCVMVGNLTNFTQGELQALLNYISSLINY